MSDNRFHKPLRVIRWLGHDIVANNPLIAMLHESRAQEIAQRKYAPVAKRRTIRITKQRIFARGAETESAAGTPTEPVTDGETPATD